MEVSVKIYINSKGKNLTTMRSILRTVEEEAEFEGIGLHFKNISINMDNPYYGNDDFVCDFLCVIDERELLDTSNERIKIYLTHVFNWYFENKDVELILVKDINITYIDEWGFNDWSYDTDDWDYGKNCYEPPKKVVKQKPLKEYITKKSNTRTVFVLKEGVL